MADADKAEELAALVAEIRDRVRARRPDGGRLQADIDLMPLVHARDAAEAKVASIGKVNPRRGGPVNALVQGVKKLVSRSLDWHVRDQVEFNRGVMACVEATLDALNETKKILARIDFEEARDLRSHWSEWRGEWEQKLFAMEMQYLKSLADLQGAFQHRTLLLEGRIQEQHANYLRALDQATAELQKKFWDEAAKARLQYEAVIHEELRIARQRLAVARPASAAPAAVGKSEAHPGFDYARFSERFRGTEDYVRKNVRIYRERFARRAPALDIGCGRGEFLEMMREAGVEARGIDLSAESVAICRNKGLDVEQANLFEYLPGLADKSLGGVFSAQVIEHLPPERLPEMIRLCSEKLARGGLLAIETPNPECLAIFASHFYIDPTHTRPVPHPLAAFSMEEFGFGQIEVQKLSPAVESMQALASLPAEFRDAFFGGLDYAIFGIKL